MNGKGGLSWSTPNKWVLLGIDGCIIKTPTETPITQGVYFYKQLLADPNLSVAFSTSRREQTRDVTMQHLNRLFGYVEFDLWMRGEDDHRPDEQLKVDAIYANGLEPSDIFLACDASGVCEAYRGLGIVTYQLDTGY